MNLLRREIYYPKTGIYHHDFTYTLTHDKFETSPGQLQKLKIDL